MTTAVIRETIDGTRMYVEVDHQTEEKRYFYPDDERSVDWSMTRRPDLGGFYVWPDDGGKDDFNVSNEADMEEIFELILGRKRYRADMELKRALQKHHVSVIEFESEDGINRKEDVEIDPGLTATAILAAGNYNSRCGTTITGKHRAWSCSRDAHNDSRPHIAMARGDRVVAIASAR